MWHFIEKMIMKAQEIKPEAQESEEGGEAMRAISPMDRSSKTRRSAAHLLAVLVTLAIIYTLGVAEKFLVPVTLAFLISMVLAPIVRWLERWHIPRTLGAGIVVIMLLTALGYGVARSMGPVGNWFDEAPAVLRKLELKIYPIKKTVEEVSKAAEQVDRITSVDSKKPVKHKTISSRDLLYENAEGLISGTVTATLLLYFLLSWGQVMISRIGGLLDEANSQQRFQELTRILEGEVSKYLSTITLINFGLGVIVGGTLFLLGMPNPILWGTVAALMNYIPYLGSLVTALLLGVTALLAFEGLTQPTLIVSAFLVLTILEGQIVTPLILGRQLALNPLVVFFSVLFWFWLWGIAGALMAVPILITLKLVGDRVKALRSISVITGR